MAVKNLTKYLTPDLKLEVGTKLYVVPPPSKKNGMTLAAIVTAGGQAGSGEDISPEVLSVLKAVRPDTNVAALALSQRVYDQMIKDEVPEPHIEQLGQYAMYYWVVGEAGADLIMESVFGHNAENSEGDEEPVEAPKD